MATSLPKSSTPVHSLTGRSGSWSGQVRRWKLPTHAILLVIGFFYVFLSCGW